MMVESCLQCDVGVNIAYSVKVIQSDEQCSQCGVGLKVSASRYFNLTLDYNRMFVF